MHPRTPNPTSLCHWRPFLLLWLIRLGLRPVKRGAALDGGKSPQFSIKSTQDSPRLNCSIAFLSITSNYLSPLIFNSQFNINVCLFWFQQLNWQRISTNEIWWISSKIFSTNMFPKPTLLTDNCIFEISANWFNIVASARGMSGMINCG